MFVGEFGNHRSGAMDQQHSQVLVPALGDSTQPGLASGRVLPGYEPEPGGEVSSAFELSGIRRTGQYRSGCLWADAGNGHQPFGLFVAPGHGFDFPVIGQDLLIELENALVDVVE